MKINYVNRPTYEEVKEADGCIEQLYVRGELTLTLKGADAYNRLTRSLYSRYVLKGNMVTKVDDIVSYSSERSCRITYNNGDVAVYTFIY